MGKHGGKAHVPVMLDDNLKSKQFYRVIDLISEGPIYGPIDQTHMSSFLVNKTPITDASGGVNVPGIAIAWREGSMNQTPINGMSYIEATTMIGLDVKYGTPIVRTITDPEVTRVRFNVGVSGLVETTSKGDQKNASVDLALEVGNPSTGSWSTAKVVTITGKISGQYLEGHYIDAPATKPFDIRVRRVTADSKTDQLQNGTIFNSYTEIIDDVLNYPGSAIAGAVIDRDQYSDTPTRTYHLRGLIVPVPDNYDPIKRTYSGIWTGGFKDEWTNNPAWIFRELVKNKRFGLAKHAGDMEVDDGALYTLSQYCDQPVKSGYGPDEPRLTLNAYITEQTTCRELLDKIAGAFRGMALWDGVRLTVLLDIPGDPISVISNANVVDGKFTYSSTKRSERYNACVVSWCDPTNGWETSKEFVADDDLIARYNYRETTLEAFGCTSRGQAWRAGKWLLETARRETRMVKFQMARDAIHFMPGDIVEIQDNNYSGARMGGRILSHNGASLAMDAAVDNVVATGDSIGLMNASGTIDHYKIQGVNGNIITLQTTPKFVKDGTVFVIDSAKVHSRLFRIMTVTEDENNNLFSITCKQHDKNKQAIVDDGAVFESPNDTLNGFRVPPIDAIRVIDVNSPAVQVRLEWDTLTTTRGLKFEVVVYNPQNNNAVIERHTTSQFFYNLFGLPAGSYQVGVRAINQMGMRGAETIVPMNIGAPPKPKSIDWQEDIFAATLVPSLGGVRSNDISFEFWMKGNGEQAVSAGGDVTAEADFLGRGAQWHLAGLKGNTTYYVYVRSRNGFGVSDFVEASGQASDNIPGMIAVVDAAIRNSNEFGLLTADVKRIDSSINIISTEVGTLQQTWTQAKADLDKDVQAFTNSISGINQTVTNADRKIDATKRDLEAQISAITGGGNSTFTGLVNDVQQVKTDQASQLTQLQAATTRMDGIDATVADQINLWRADDAVIATDVANVTATAAKAAADITTEQQARAAGDSSLAERIDKMVSTAPADQNHADRKALMQTITQTETDADKALSLRIDNFQAANGNWQAKIDAATKAAADGDKALADRISNMFVTGGADNTALNNTINSVVVTATASTGNQLSRLNTRMGNAESDIQAEAQARTLADSALTQRIDKMLSTTGTPSGDRAALLQTIASTSSTATDAVARRASALEAKVDGVPNDPTQLGLIARVDVLEQTTSGPNGTVATRLSKLETFQTQASTDGLPANQATKNLIADAKKAGTDAGTAAGTAASAAAAAQNDINGLKPQIQTAIQYGSRITQLEKTLSGTDTSTASRFDSLESFRSTVTTNGAPANQNTKDLITDAKKAGTDAAKAAATAQGAADTANTAIATIKNQLKTGVEPTKAWTDMITQHNTTLGNLSSTVQTAVTTEVNKANGALNAQWGVKVETTAANGMRYISGMQLGITTKAGQQTSNFIIAANKFAVYNNVDGGQNFAFSAEKGQVFLSSAFIKDASITNAKIGDTIESSGYAAHGGWQLKKGDGKTTFGSLTITSAPPASKGQRVVVNSSGLAVYDSNNVLRVKVGTW